MAQNLLQNLDTHTGIDHVGGKSVPETVGAVTLILQTSPLKCLSHCTPGRNITQWFVVCGAKWMACSWAEVNGKVSRKTISVRGLELTALPKSPLCRHFAANRFGLFEKEVISHAGYEISDLFFWAVFLQILRINVIHQVNMAGQVFR
jgi:hypothetical protein